MGIHDRLKCHLPEGAATRTPVAFEPIEDVTEPDELAMRVYSFIVNISSDQAINDNNSIMIMIPGLRFPRSCPSGIREGARRAIYGVGFAR